jgi:hypothetical protein
MSFDPGWGSRVRCVASGVEPEHAEHSTHLGERLAAGGLDRGERLLRLGRVSVDEVVTDAGLHGNDAHRVGDQIVQLAGDPGPFVEHGLVGDAFLLGIHGGQSGSLFGARRIRLRVPSPSATAVAIANTSNAESAAFGSQLADW